MRISSINPIGWAHAELQGGLRRSALIGVGYLVVVFIFIGMAQRSAGVGVTLSASTFATTVLSVLMGLQSVLLLLFVSSNVRKAVQKDFTSGMMESHRLCPVSGWTAVLGYLTGPSVHVAGVTLANLVLVFFLAVSSDLGFQAVAAWCFGLVLSVVAAALLGVLSLLLALCTRASMGAVGLLTFLLIFGGAQLAFVVPGLGVAAGFLPIASTIKSAGRGGIRIDLNVIFSACWQIALGLIAAAAAARRYPRDDQPAFTWRLGMIAVFLAAQAGCIGIVMWLKDYQARWGGWMTDDLGTNWIPTLGMLLLTCILPVAAAAKARIRCLQVRAIDPGGGPHRAMPMILVCAIGAITVGVVAGQVLGPVVELHPRWWHIAGHQDPPDSIRACAQFGGLTAITVLLAVLPLGGVLQVLYGYRERVVWFALAWLMLTWAGPPFLDMVRYAFADEPHTPEMTWLMTCSPLGWWAYMWHGPANFVEAWIGAVVQLGLVLTCGFLLPIAVGRRQVAAFRRRIEQADAAPAVVTSPAAPSAAALRR